MTQASARRNLSGWQWIPFTEKDATGRDLSVITWAAWRRPPRDSTAALVSLMGETPWPAPVPGGPPEQDPPVSG